LCNGALADASLGEPPFATVTASGGRRLLAALNPAAEKAGLAPGMPLPDALSFLPGLATMPADPAADNAALTRLAEWCNRYSPWTAPDDSDGVKIEITGSAHLWGGEAALVADLARRLTRQNIAHRIATAGTLGAAWALARYTADDGQPALPAPLDERAALAPLPVEALRLDPDTVRGLRRVGLRQVGELYPMPRDALARRFGDVVARRLDQAFGDLPEPLSPLGETPSRRVRLSFPEPIADPTDLARAIERLVEDLAARLAREGMGARRLALGFHRVDGRVEHIRIGTARPSRDPRHLAKLFIAKLDTVDLGDDPGLGIEDMILAVFAADPLPPEQLASRFRDPHPQAGEEVRRASGGQVGASEEIESSLASLLDRLGNRFGLDAISHIAPRASHIPEKASIFTSMGDEKVSSSESQKQPRGRACPVGLQPTDLIRGHPRLGAASDVEKKSWVPGTSPGTGVSEVGGNIRKPPRPVRLFRPPEPVEAQWVLPDDPPFRFHWRRVWHRVRHADGPERIAQEWWTADSAADPRESGDSIRDYYRVEDEEGRRFWLYRAGLPGDPPPRWFVHGIFA
ncbi:MAG: DNA polymerase Y family protein, partial [Alphaproteobacteria bacterium]|nr:DNA polymerase Y family protein [Alphaproteobacteria bacterium]